MSVEQEIIEGRVPGAYAFDFEEIVSPIATLNVIAVRAAFFFGWSCMIVALILFGFVNVFCGFLGPILGYVALFSTFYVNASIFVFFQFIVLTGFKTVAILWRVTPENVEAVIYKTYAPLFAESYNIVHDSKGGVTATLALEEGFFDWVFKMFVMILLPITRYGFKTVTRFKSIPDLSIRPLRTEIDFKEAQTSAEVLGVPYEAFLGATLVSPTPVNAWDDEAVKLQHPWIGFAMCLARLVILLRVDIRTVIIVSFWALPISILYSLLVLLKLGKKGLEIVIATVKLWMIGIALSLCVPVQILDVWMTLYYKLYFQYPLMFCTRVLNPFFWYRVFRFIKALILAGFVKGLLAYQFMSLLLERNQTSTVMLSRKAKIVGRFNQSWASLQLVVSDIALPEYIRSFNLDFSASSLQETFDKLASLGWPVNVSVLPDATYAGDFADWFVTKIDFTQGIHNLQCHIDADLALFEADNNLVYKRTETYASYKNELNTTSRYFYRPEYQFSDIQLSDAWDVFGEIFENSRLTPFNRIIKRWEKKYGLAAWAKVKGPLGRERKLSRREFISQIGLPKFKQLWWETFKIAPSLVPINPVSVKREALPQKKWLFDKVRTVIGSPITQYISATIWDSYPAHNFKWQTTPSKIGMPLNGWAMGKVFAEHAKRDYHFAGDCSAFDSTLSGPVLDNIAALFKKGYENHKNRNAICDLIDHNKVQVENGLLALTSTGSVYNKGLGLTTGHSTTSLSNTMGMGTLYLAAHRKLTGQSARQFKHFNTMSLYGDDNMISWSKDAPPTWTFGNIQNVMSAWGVDLRLEAAGDLEKIEFLSKFARRPTQGDISEFAHVGVDVPEWVIYHNRDKLVGKIKAPVKSRRATYTIKRLISYLDLTASHKDIYDNLTAIIAKKITAARDKEGDRTKYVIPTYQAVMKNWYNPSTDFSDHEAEDSFIEDKVKEGLVLFGEMNIFDHFTNFLARVVDVFNPDVYNSTFTNFIQRPFRKYMEWPAKMISEANSAHTARHLAQLVNKSPYDWISSEVELICTGDPKFATSRLIKHWVYMALRKSGGSYFSAWVLATDKKIADLKALSVGYLDLAIRRQDVPFWNILLVTLLGIVPDIPLPSLHEFPGVASFKKFTLGYCADLIFGIVLNQLWSLTPPNFTAVLASIDSLEVGVPITIQADTGTGKTTSMINIIAKRFPRYNRIIVIEPRSAIVSGVVPYMKGKYGIDCTALTQGSEYDPASRVVYCTPMEVILHTEFLNQNCLFILDESHVEEPLHIFIDKYLSDRDVPFVRTSATPKPSPSVVYLGAPQLWKIEDVSANELINLSPSYSVFRTLLSTQESRGVYAAQMQIYRGFVSHYLANANPWAKSLVFVNTVKEVEMFLGSLKPGPSGPVVGFWSGHTDLPENWSVIVTTSVCDVGVTLPNVDHVFTTNTELTVRVIDGKTGPEYCEASPALLKQRRGRTGRTNNGRSIVFKIFGMPAKKPVLFKELFINFLNAGISFTDIFLHYESEVRALIGEDQFVEKFQRELAMAEEKVFSFGRQFSSASANRGPKAPGTFAIDGVVREWATDLVPSLSDFYAPVFEPWSLLSDIGSFVSVALNENFKVVDLFLPDKREIGRPLFEAVPQGDEGSVLVGQALMNAQIQHAHTELPAIQEEIEQLEAQAVQYSAAVETINGRLHEAHSRATIAAFQPVEDQVWRFFRFHLAKDWWSLYEMSGVINAFKEFIRMYDYYENLLDGILEDVSPTGNLRILDDEKYSDDVTEILKGFQEFVEENQLSIDIPPGFLNPYFGMFGSYHSVSRD